ncbi:histidinol-phosphatase HisJ family protein [Clostridium sp. CCUG 7971]|uniref:histidinol-phosphatase HisJ family protein n=1 Tax=Clostridium sp. CCUG 7971 TaxID=2811414 RepID=UPI001ABA3B6D|nr:histidinol-phosphatase HisJ family protein [Clostridium sp. CCUG 7971]MBO3445541.1 histidinol-phosphatase HisJ family protein [Clostridium sp. CCUG 7971]
MNILDNHVHTHFSSDAKDNMGDVIKRAINIGVKHLTFTDHLEYRDTGFSLDCNEYVKQIQKYKEKYKKDIEILIGIEVGYQSYIKDKIEDVLNSNPFDFVLCSTHRVDKQRLVQSEFFNGLSKEEAYTKYFESIIKTTKEFNDYDTYGHLDYIIRYGKYEDNKIIYNDYKDVLDNLLKSIIDSGKGIEINTSGYRYNLNATHPKIDILKRYKELGGKIITLGSDAHRAVDVCRDFDKSYAILESLGFKYVCLYRERKAEFLTLNKDIIYSL